MRILFLISCVLLSFSSTLYCQFNLIPSSIPLDSRHSRYNYVEPKHDTIVIMDVVHKAEDLMNNPYWMNLDSVTPLLHLALKKSLELNFHKGINNGYINLGLAYMYKDIGDSMRYYFKKGIELEESICREKMLPMYYWYYGDGFMKDAKADSAAIIYSKGKNWAKELKDTNNLQVCLYKLSNAYLTSGEYLMAFKESMELMELAKIHSDTFDLLYANRSLYIVYSHLGQQEKCMEIIHHTIKLMDGIKNENRKWREYYMIISAYEQEGKYDSVMYYARLATPIDDQRGVPRLSYQSMAGAFIHLNQMDSACYYIHLFYDQAIQTGQMDVATYLYLGKCEQWQNNQKKALEYYRLAEKNYANEGPETQRWICQALSEYFDSIGQDQAAFHYLKKYKLLTDKIAFNEKTFKVGVESMEQEALKLQSQLSMAEQDRALQAFIASRQRQQKNLVYASSGLLLILGGFSFYRFRKNRNLKNKQDLLTERLRISRDLHDEVGATLSGIAMYSHLAKSQIETGSSGSLQKSLDTIQQSSAEMVLKLSDIVWLLNPTQDTLKQLLDKLEDYAKKMGAMKHVKVRFDVPESLDTVSLPLDVRRNIYLIFKEAIHNSMKYSLAREMAMEVQENLHTLQIVWKDNGIGFDMTNGHMGNGLKNMHKRAEEINATLNINSNIEGGSKIEAFIPVQSKTF